MSSGVDPGTDFDDAIRALDDLESNSPSDLPGDVDTFIDVMKRIDDAPADSTCTDSTCADFTCEGLPDDIFS